MLWWRILLPYGALLLAVGYYLALAAPPDTILLRREISVADVVGFAIGGSAIVALFINASQAQRSAQQEALQTSALKAQLLLRIRDMLFDDTEERRFVYRLDYQQFRFTPETFAGSEDERHLDSLLYKLVHIGYLLRSRLLTVADLTPVRSIIGCILHNPGVGDYLVWLKEEQHPMHSSFTDAIYLVEQTHGRGHAGWAKLDRYLAQQHVVN